MGFEVRGVGNEHDEFAIKGWGLRFGVRGVGNAHDESVIKGGGLVQGVRDVGNETILFRGMIVFRERVGR